MIVGTAGHIDHGKTALVHALTGVDADRLPEEKKRGITIELGYAAMEVPGAEPIGFVDVPGHEKLVRTMVAGASGMDITLLLIAADDGVMPQTIEAIQHARAAGVPIVVAMNKIDKPSANPAKVIWFARNPRADRLPPHAFSIGSNTLRITPSSIDTPFRLRLRKRRAG